jgi:hypothetical protein
MVIESRLSKVESVASLSEYDLPATLSRVLDIKGFELARGFFRTTFLCILWNILFVDDRWLISA